MICVTCQDQRFVTIRLEARRHTKENSASNVYPCPICGPFVFDGDGEKYGVPGRRYGNPNLREHADYGFWRARNASKAAGWHLLPLLSSEEPDAARLQREFPGAKREWIKAWVLGERKVYQDQEAEDPDYDPRKDADFLELAAIERKHRIKEQAAMLDQYEPEWWRRVQNNIPVDLSDFQKELIKEHERQRKVAAFLHEQGEPTFKP